MYAASQCLGNTFFFFWNIYGVECLLTTQSIARTAPELEGPVAFKALAKGLEGLSKPVSRVVLEGCHFVHWFSIFWSGFCAGERLTAQRLKSSASPLYRYSTGCSKAGVLCVSSSHVSEWPPGLSRMPQVILHGLCQAGHNLYSK